MSVFLQPIYTQTVGSGGVASITFNSIPQTFTDLKVVVSCRVDVSGTRMNVNLRFNGSSSSIYSNTVVSGGGSSASSGRNYTGNTQIYLNEVNGNTSTANTFSNFEIYVPNYANTSTYKSFTADSVYENNITEAYQVLCAGLFLSTNAISSITLFPGAYNFMQYSTFSLYGVLRAGI